MSAIEIRGLDHVVLRTVDPQRSMRFYCEVLGCVEERSLAELGLYQLRAGAQLIDLVDTDPNLRSIAQSLAAELLNFSTYQGYLTRHLEDRKTEDVELAVRITGLVGVSAARAFVAAPEEPVDKEIFAREVGKMLTQYLTAGED